MNTDTPDYIPLSRIPPDVFAAAETLDHYLALQLADVWWKVTEVGGNLQHGDLDNENTRFSVVLVKHGGYCFHGETPLDAWRTAYQWLVSPERGTTGGQIEPNPLKP